MEDKSLSELLSAYDNRISRSSAVDLQAFKEMQEKKSTYSLKGLLRQRTIEMTLALIINLLLGSFLYFNWSNPGLVISAAVIMIFTIIGISGCIRQIVLIKWFNFSRNITQSQSNLAKLQFYALNYLRWGILQLPFYMAYVAIGFQLIFGVDILHQENPNWLISQAVLSLLLVPFSLWLYLKITYHNINIGWVKYIIETSGGKKIASAMEFLNEVEQFGR